MGYTSVDQRSKLLLTFDVHVQYVTGHIHQLYDLDFFAVLEIFFQSYRHVLGFLKLAGLHPKNNVIQLALAQLQDLLEAEFFTGHKLFLHALKNRKRVFLRVFIRQLFENCKHLDADQFLLDWILPPRWLLILFFLVPSSTFKLVVNPSQELESLFLIRWHRRAAVCLI